MVIEEDLENIYKRYHNDIRMVKEFLDNITKLLSRRQKKVCRIFSDFSEEDMKEYEEFKKFIQKDKTDKKANPVTLKSTIYLSDDNVIIEASKGSKLTLKSSKVVKVLTGFSLPMKQKRFLAEMVLAYLISRQEAFFKEYFQKDRTHGGIDGICKYLKKEFSISLESDLADWVIVREANLRRNLIIHNNGITDRDYCSKTGYKKTNENLKTDLDYVLNATNAIISFIDFMHSRIREKRGSLPHPASYY